MSIKVSVKQETKQSQELPRNCKPSQLSFKGGGWIAATMEQVHNNYAVGFVSQDMLGMAVPRIGAGLNRNRDKTGEYNWKFAAQETIRELITGPSAIGIPFAMLFGARKFFGQANAVSCEFINGLGGQFAEYAKANPKMLGDADALKAGFYKNALKNMLSTTTGVNAEQELDKMAGEYANRLIECEKAPKKRFWNAIGIGPKPEKGKSAQELLASLTSDVMNFKKKHAAANDDAMNVAFKTVEINEKTKLPENIETSFGKFVEHLHNYTADATASIKKSFSASAEETIESFVKKFNSKRAGSRFLTNLSMLGATVAFFMYIPKLYKRKDGNPGLAGLEVDKVQISGKEGV